MGGTGKLVCPCFSDTVLLFAALVIVCSFVCETNALGNNVQQMCIYAGGSWESSQSLCYFNGNTSPTGWQQKENYSSTQTTNCPNQVLGGICEERQTFGHTRQNIAIENCNQYWGDNREFLTRMLCNCI